VKDERTNRLLERIATQLEALRASDSGGHAAPVLDLPRSEIEYCRDTWEEGVLRGEQELYDLATLLCTRLTGAHNIEHVARVVVGLKEEDESAGAKRIVIEEHLSRENLKRFTDYSLAQRIARRYRYRESHDQPLGLLYPRASFLELWPLESREDAPATRVLTRVKSNDQIWNKVCDALFDIDSIVARDKILNSRSKYIKDVFGIKILTPRRVDSYNVHQLLDEVRFETAELERLGLDPRPERLGLELIEHKDYLSVAPEQKKRTGWEALKNVYRWGHELFEVQIQTEANYFLEAMHLTDTSHRTFEMQRRVMRRQIEEKVPHYEGFRRLLKTVFQRDDDALDALGTELPWLSVSR
jgi:hypothetical protein